MMTDYPMTEQEQLEMIKRWWKEYGVLVVIAILIGLAVGFGWKYWKQEQLQSTLQASALYQHALLTAGQSQLKPTLQLANDLQEHYNQTPYAVMGNLLAAKVAVNQDQWGDAIIRLQWVISHAKSLSFKEIARLRLSRILLMQKKPIAALAVLAVVDDAAYQPAVDQIRGDIYLSLGKKTQARTAYLSAKAALDKTNIQDPLLEMKLAQPDLF